MPKLPENVTEDHLMYLDDLRELGIVNMFGAGPYLQKEFKIDEKTAKKILLFWIESFSDKEED